MKNKNPQIVSILENFLATNDFHPEALDSKNNICALCGHPAAMFRDALSVKEYSISKLCQSCQDSVFGQDDDFGEDNG